MIEVGHEDAPSYWASYFVNGDASGLEPEDVTEADAWLESLAVDGWRVVSTTNDEGRIMWWTDHKVHHVITYVLYRVTP